MIVSGLLLQYDSGQTQAVATALRAVAGISELTILESSGRMACVLEIPNAQAAEATVARLHQVDGVYAVMPTYIHELEEA